MHAKRRAGQATRAYSIVVVIVMLLTASAAAALLFLLLSFLYLARAIAVDIVTYFCSLRLSLSFLAELIHLSLLSSSLLLLLLLLFQSNLVALIKFFTHTISQKLVQILWHTHTHTHNRTHARTRKIHKQQIDRRFSRTGDATAGTESTENYFRSAKS